jgi:hypothetical protein
MPRSPACVVAAPNDLATIVDALGKTQSMAPGVVQCMAVMFAVGEGQPLRTTHMVERLLDSATLFQ